ncbi:MAG: flagellar M-ring protein FliF [Verrucomicrobia bacterium]|nr:flagellar M-ring protein FliF [Verrucomicrobiota bacterium]
MKQVLDQIKKIWSELTPTHRIIVSTATVAVIAGIGALLYWAQRPDMKLLFGKLGEKEASEVVTALEEQGIPFELGAGGSAIYVPSKDVYRVRMDLAAKGLPNTEGVGFEIFDRSNFGISDFVQRTNYTRALQGELSRTVAQMQGVKAARVMIVMPESRLLVRTTDSRPTASVFVDTGTNTLDKSAVNSIRSLVANSVEGLKLDDVAVVDSAGNVLSDELKSDPQLSSASSIVKYRQQTEEYLAAKVETMLAKVLKPGNAVVRVAAEINTQALTRTEEKFDPEGQVPRQETLIEDTQSTREEAPEGAAGVGTAANVPTDRPPQQVPTKSSDSARSSRTQSYEINKTLTNIVQNPGEITRITAAVFLAERSAETGEPLPRSPQEIDSIRSMVINTLGIVVPRGESPNDFVSITEMPFPPSSIAPDPAADRFGQYMEFIRPIAALVIAAIVFGIFFFMLRRAKPEEISFELVDDSMQNKSAGALPDAQTSEDAEQQGEEKPDPMSFLPAARNLKVSPELLNQLIRQKPENVGATLREWLLNKTST